MRDGYGAIARKTDACWPANNHRFGNTGSRILLSVLFTVESICGRSTTYVRVRMEMNLAFSDRELEIIKILNKRLRLYPISMVPCKRYEAKSCRDVASIMTCTCLSRASLLHRPWIWLRLSNYHTLNLTFSCQRHKNFSPFPDRLRGSRSLLADVREGSSVVKWPESEAIHWHLSVSKFRNACKFTTVLV